MYRSIVEATERTNLSNVWSYCINLEHIYINRVSTNLFERSDDFDWTPPIHAGVFENTKGKRFDHYTIAIIQWHLLCNITATCCYWSPIRISIASKANAIRNGSIIGDVSNDTTILLDGKSYFAVRIDVVIRSHPNIYVSGESRSVLFCKPCQSNLRRG